MSLNKVLRYIIIGGLFLIPGTLLIITDSLFFPFITGKAFFFRILVEILFGTWIALMIFDPVYRPKNSGLVMVLGGLLLILVAATVFGENPYRSFWSNFERMEGLITFIHLGAYFVVLISAFKRERLWHWFFHTFFGVGIVLMVYSLFQLMGWIQITQGANRINATLGNASYLAVTCLWLIFLSLAFFVERERSSKRSSFLYLLFISAQVFFLFQTQTRGAVLGFMIGLTVTFALIAWRERANVFLRRFALSSLVLMVVLVIGFLLVKDQSWVRNNPTLSRLSSISFSSGQSRFVIWEMALRGFQEKPILGWGPENFNLVFDKYYDTGLYNQEQWFDRAHNIFLDWLIHAGLLGLIAYLALFVVAVYYIWQSQHFSPAKKAVLTGLLVAYFFHNMFVFDHLASYLFFFTLLAYLHHDRVSVIPQQVNQLGFSRPLVFGLLSVVGGGILVLVYFLNVKPLVASSQLIKAISRPSLEERFLAFNDIFDSKTFAASEAVEQLPNVAVQVWHNQEIPPALRDTWFQFTINKLNQEMEKINTARLPYITGSFLDLVGQPDLAIKYLEQARSLSPQKQSILIQLAVVYQKSGETTKALLTAKEAFELEERNDDVRTLYAVLAILNNDFVLSDSLIEQNPFPDERLINAYAEKRQYHRVVELWQRRVTYQPQNTQSRFSLAAAYFVLGQKSQAITELETAAQIDPRLRPQVDQIISEIRAGRNPLAQ